MSVKSLYQKAAELVRFMCDQHQVPTELVAPYWEDLSDKANSYYLQMMKERFDGVLTWQTREAYVALLSTEPGFNVVQFREDCNPRNIPSWEVGATYTIKTVEIGVEQKYLSGEFVAYRFVSVQAFEGASSVAFFSYRFDYRIDNSYYVSLSDGSHIKNVSETVLHAMKTQAIRMQFGETTELKAAK